MTGAFVFWLAATWDSIMSWIAEHWMTTPLAFFLSGVIFGHMFTEVLSAIANLVNKLVVRPVVLIAICFGLYLFVQTKRLLHIP